MKVAPRKRRYFFGENVMCTVIAFEVFEKLQKAVPNYDHAALIKLARAAATHGADVSEDLGVFHFKDHIIVVSPFNVVCLYAKLQQQM